MAARERVRRYREVGGASDLVRVELLVPAAKRDALIADAARLRARHREKKQRLKALCATAVDRYSVRLFDNVDLSRIDDPRKRGSIIANALMERGDARAFAMGRRILAEMEA